MRTDLTPFQRQSLRTAYLPEDLSPLEWIRSNDTGVSSKAIWSRMTMLPLYDSSSRSAPRDPSDFGRCYRLLLLFPEWRARMGEMAMVTPQWAKMVERWDEMTALYEEEAPTGKAPKLYDLMREIWKP